MAEDEGNKPDPQAMLLRVRGELAHRRLLAKDPKNHLSNAERQALEGAKKNRPTQS